MFIQDQTELVSWGGNTEERRRGRTPVAESQVTISLKDVETMGLIAFDGVAGV